jgi:hypothetical protein
MFNYNTASLELFLPAATGAASGAVDGAASGAVDGAAPNSWSQWAQ